MKLRVGKYIIVLNITNSYYIEEFFSADLFIIQI